MGYENEVDQLVAVDIALESMRDSGYDLATAVGGVVRPRHIIRRVQGQSLDFPCRSSAKTYCVKCL